MARRFEEAGGASLLFTDGGRDVLLKGVNIEATVDLARATDLSVIASGGVAGISDIHMLAIHARDGIAGVITGRALYDGRLDLAAALSVAGAAGASARAGSGEHTAELQSLMATSCAVFSLKKNKRRTQL